MRARQSGGGSGSGSNSSSGGGNRAGRADAASESDEEAEAEDASGAAGEGAGEPLRAQPAGSLDDGEEETETEGEGEDSESVSSSPSPRQRSGRPKSLLNLLAGGAAVSRSRSSGEGGEAGGAAARFAASSAAAAAARAASNDAADAAERAKHELRQESERAWMRRDKNVLVFSRAGKPVYSSGADELELSSVFSLLQAMLARTGDRLRVIRAGPGLVMVFAIRGPLMLAVVSRRDEPVGYLQLQLEYVYAQILFHFTFSALDDTFRRKPGYDLRALLGGTRTELEGVVESAGGSPAMLLEAVPVLQLAAEARAAATAVLFSVRQPNLLYAILLAEGKLVTYVSPRRHPLRASDLLLLINFVAKARQLRSQETWTPLCLPGFDCTGFLHAYAAFVSERICLLVLSSGESLEQFHYCSQSKASVAEQLARSGVASRIEAAAAAVGLAPTSCEAASSIHLVYRSLKYDQFFETRVAAHAPLHDGWPGARQRLIARYASVSERLHSNSRRVQIVAPVAAPAGQPGPPPPPQQQQQQQGGGRPQAAPPHALVNYATAVEQGEIWDVHGCEAVLALAHPPNYELYATFHLVTSAAQAMACATRFAAWVRANRNDLFLVKPPQW